MNKTNAAAMMLQDVHHYFGSVLAHYGTRTQQLTCDTTFKADTLKSALECYESGRTKLGLVLCDSVADAHRDLYDRVYDTMVDSDNITSQKELVKLCAAGFQICGQLAKRLGIDAHTGTLTDAQLVKEAMAYLQQDEGKI